MRRVRKDAGLHVPPEFVEGPFHHIRYIRVLLNETGDGFRAKVKKIMADESLAQLVCCENPARVFAGDDVEGGEARKRTASRSSRKPSGRPKSRKGGFGFGWFGR